MQLFLFDLSLFISLFNIYIYIYFFLLQTECGSVEEMKWRRQDANALQLQARSKTSAAKQNYLPFAAQSRANCAGICVCIQGSHNSHKAHWTSTDSELCLHRILHRCLYPRPHCRHLLRQKLAEYTHDDAARKQGTGLCKLPRVASQV